MSADSHQRIDEAAGGWFARRESGEWTPADQERLDQWLEESPLHRVAWLRIEHAWERAERLKALRTVDGTVPPPGDYVLSPFFNRSPAVPPLSLALPGGGAGGGARGSEAEAGIRPPRVGPRRKLAFGIAAGLVAALALTSAWLIWPKDAVYRTPVGGLETVPLTDGSILTLNTDSAVALRFTSRERRVQLRRGEVFFEVAKDPARPFVVEAGDRRVVAVGTQFAVRREGDDGDIQVVVTEGTVRMEREGAAPVRAPDDRTNPAGSGNVLLPAGTIAHASGNGVLLQKTALPAAEESLSWREGVLVFHDMTLAQAAAEFNRYNTRQIVIDNPKVAEMTVAGSFRATNADAFVRLLEKGYPVRSEIRDHEIVIVGR